MTELEDVMAKLTRRDKDELALLKSPRFSAGTALALMAKRRKQGSDKLRCLYCAEPSVDGLTCEEHRGSDA